MMRVYSRDGSFREGFWRAPRADASKLPYSVDDPQSRQSGSCAPSCRTRPPCRVRQNWSAEQDEVASPLGSRRAAARRRLRSLSRRDGGRSFCGRSASLSARRWAFAMVADVALTGWTATGGTSSTRATCNGCLDLPAERDRSFQIRRLCRPKLKSTCRPLGCSKWLRSGPGAWTFSSTHELGVGL